MSSSTLISAAALQDMGAVLDSRSVDRSANTALSACTGEARMGDFTHSSAAVSATWTSTVHKRERLTETVVQTSSTKKATTLAKRLVKEIASCQHEPKGHWYYGKKTHRTISGGSATYFYAHDWRGTPSHGGVSVIAKGSRVGVFEISNAPDLGPGLMYHLRVTEPSRP